MSSPSLRNLSSFDFPLVFPSLLRAPDQRVRVRPIQCPDSRDQFVRKRKRRLERHPPPRLGARRAAVEPHPSHRIHQFTPTVDEVRDPERVFRAGRSRLGTSGLVEEDWPWGEREIARYFPLATHLGPSVTS